MERVYIKQPVLDDILPTLRNYNRSTLTCVSLMFRISFCGYVFTADGAKSEPSYIEAVLETDNPIDKET